MYKKSRISKNEKKNNYVIDILINIALIVYYMIKYSLLLIMTISSILSMIAITEPQQIVYAEKDYENENELSERDVAVLCGATEDYEAHKEQCDKLYDMLEEGEIKDDPDFEYD